MQNASFRPLPLRGEGHQRRWMKRSGFRDRLYLSLDGGLDIQRPGIHPYPTRNWKILELYIYIYFLGEWLIDFLSFYDLIKGQCTRKCNHLFPVWSLFIKWLFITPPTPIKGEQYGKMERNTPRVVTVRVYLRIYIYKFQYSSLKVAYIEQWTQLSTP